MDAERAWAAVVARSRDADFVFAVTTTGIYCRPSCPARRPKRENARFYPTAARAEAAGFRACKRCRPRAPRSPADTLVARARAVLDRAELKVTLAALADEVGASPFHLQRAFKRALGVSPRAYAEALRVARFRGAAKGARTVLDAAHAAGFGSSRAIHAAPLGLTPGRIRAGGEGERIGYAVLATRHGRLLVAAGPRGVVRVALGDRADDLIASLRADLPRATLVRDPALRAVAAAIAAGDDADVPLDLRGTALELRVWDALRKIPRGETRTYTELAAAVGQPRAVRAVARACAKNPVALVVPCHRVVRKDGDLAGYAWGLARKKKLLAAEAR